MYQIVYLSVPHKSWVYEIIVNTKAKWNPVGKNKVAWSALLPDQIVGDQAMEGAPLAVTDNSDKGIPNKRHTFMQELDTDREIQILVSIYFFVYGSLHS